MSFMISEVCGTAIGMVLTRFTYPLPYLLGPLARTLLANSLMAGAVMALAQWLPVPSVGAFSLLAATGALVYGLAALGLNICDSRTMLRTLAVRLFGRRGVIPVVVGEPPIQPG
jgi:hypothetical protein